MQIVESGQGARPRIWCLMRDQFAHVKPVEESMGERAEFIYDKVWDPAGMLAAKPDVVLCVNEFQYEVTQCLEAARSAGIPSLLIQDGILEWRCQYENPLFGPVPQHRPVLADKIACIGAQSARAIASWGNAGKAEVTGMPRLDALLARPVAPRHSPGNRILVMTAKNPGFTAEQVAVTLQSLKDVRDCLRSQEGLSVVWRVTRNLSDVLEVSNELTELSTWDLARVLGNVDAVITTPSTAMLEAMILDRPVACLDYHNVPRFVPTAWTISAPMHIAPVVTELRNPSNRKMEFQRHALEDTLSCSSPASPRVGELLSRMAAAPGLQARIVSLDGRAQSVSDAQPIATEDDVDRLQVRLARLESENARLVAELGTRRFGYWADVLMRSVARRVRHAKAH